MKKILKYFFRGVLVVAPAAITIFVLYKIIVFADSFFINILKPTNIYFPGVGVLLTFIMITAVGLLASNWLTGKIFNLIDVTFTRVPFVKVIYTALKDTISSFIDGKKGFSKLAVIKFPASDIRLLGFITNDRMEQLDAGLRGYVSVYLMQSMQWAGNLILVPGEWVEVLDISAEEAIKFIASAGLISGKTVKSGQ